jgi:outer membrane murein-binding lipoprotein Lpp
MRSGLYDQYKIEKLATEVVILAEKLKSLEQNSNISKYVDEIR